jgi:hypothetical protein
MLGQQQRTTGLKTLKTLGEYQHHVQNLWRSWLRKRNAGQEYPKHGSTDGIDFYINTRHSRWANEWKSPAGMFGGGGVWMLLWEDWIDKRIGGARDSVFGWGTILQAGRSRVRFPMRSLNFFNWPNPSSRTMALGSTQPLTEMSTKNLPGSKGWPEHKADNLTAICKPTVYKMWEPRRFTTLRAFTACYKDSFALPLPGYSEWTSSLSSPRPCAAAVAMAAPLEPSSKS